MAAAVLDLDLTNLPPEVTCDPRYRNAYILLRWHRRPVGSVTVPLTDGRLDTSGLRAALMATSDHVLGDALVEEMVGSRVGAPLPTATVAVCTHERPHHLEVALPALQPLAEQGIPVLIVDSGPTTERTREVAERFPQMRYVREKRKGLDRARNLALREADTEIVAFTDDDAVVEPDWLSSLLPGFDDRLVMAVSGLTLPAELESDAQESHEKYSTFSRGFRRRVLEATRNSPGAAGTPGAGVNMAIRREAVNCVGYFDPALDAGTPTRSGGDCEFLWRLLARGYRVAYEPGAVSWHHHRQSREDLRDALFGYGIGVYAAFTRAFFAEREVSVVRTAAAWFVKEQVPELFASMLRRPGAPPLDLWIPLIAGCAVGPWAYARSRMQR